MSAFHSELRLRLPRYGKVLDLGCGTNSELAIYRTASREVWGADFQLHPDLTNSQWFRLMEPTGMIPFPDRTFDVVTAIWVLEHVVQPEQFLGEVQRVLRPGGYFVAHTISGNHYVTWVRRLLDVLPFKILQKLVRYLYARPVHDTFPTSYRLDTQIQLRRACHNTGLILQRLQRSADQGYFGFNRTVMTLANLCDWALATGSPRLGRLYLTVTLQNPAAWSSDRVGGPTSELAERPPSTAACLRVPA